MYGFHQKRAVWLWHSQPHVLIWLCLLACLTLLGFGHGFFAIQPALPLLMALVWVWEWRRLDIAVSLLFSGLVLDVVSGAPLGLHALLWAGIYLLAPYTLRHIEDDEPFVARWLICGAWLALYLWTELLFGAAFGLATPQLSSLLMKWLVMFFLVPLLSWVAWRTKKACYRRLWMLLPREMRVSFRK